MKNSHNKAFSVFLFFTVLVSLLSFATSLKECSSDHENTTEKMMIVELINADMSTGIVQVEFDEDLKNGITHTEGGLKFVVKTYGDTYKTSFISPVMSSVSTFDIKENHHIVHIYSSSGIYTRDMGRIY